jgi:hypothetical protein
VGLNVVVGVIPIVGQIADARDTVAAIRNVWNAPKTGGAWVGLGLAAVGWIPIAGDAIKGARIGGKIVKEVGEKALKESGEKALKEAAVKEAKEAAKEAADKEAVKAAKEATENAVEEGGPDACPAAGIRTP